MFLNPFTKLLSVHAHYSAKLLTFPLYPTTLYNYEVLKRVKLGCINQSINSVYVKTQLMKGLVIQAAHSTIKSQFPLEWWLYGRLKSIVLLILVRFVQYIINWLRTVLFVMIFKQFTTLVFVSSTCTMVYSNIVLIKLGKLGHWVQNVLASNGLALLC